MGFFRSADTSGGEGSSGGEGKPDREPLSDGTPGTDDGERAPTAGRAAALARIEAGGIPLSAERRLKALGTDGSLFTSGLSVNEFSLLSALGPRPLAQVMGGSVVRLGQALLPAVPPSRRWSATGYSRQIQEPTPYEKAAYQRTTMVLKVEVLTNAWTEARRNALNRLSEEALQVGADVVVGVELRRGEHDLAKRTIDYLISGTAIRLSGSTQTNWPLLSDLSVQDYWRLHEAGYEPAGLVAATSVVFASASRGVLGIPYYVRRKGDADRKGWLITMHGAGTAIRRREIVPQYPPEKTMRLGRK